MTRSPKSPSRAELLAEIDQALGRLELVQAGEVTAPMLATRQGIEHVTAIRALRRGQKLGKFTSPVLRRTADGRRVWAWKPMGRARHTCGACGSKLDAVRPGKWQCPACP